MANDKPVHDTIMTKVLYASSLNFDTPLVPCTRMAETTLSLVIITCKRNDFAGDLACCCLRDAISCRQTSTWRARSEPADTLYFCSISLSDVSYRPECKQVHTQPGKTLACIPMNLRNLVSKTKNFWTQNCGTFDNAVCEETKSVIKVTALWYVTPCNLVNEYTASQPRKIILKPWQSISNSFNTDFIIAYFWQLMVYALI